MKVFLLCLLTLAAGHEEVYEPVDACDLGDGQFEAHLASNCQLCGLDGFVYVVGQSDCNGEKCSTPSTACAVSKSDGTFSCQNVPTACSAQYIPGAPVSPTGCIPEVPPPIDVAPAVCGDVHANCCFWASIRECNNNPKYMRTKCQKSCGTCGCTDEATAVSCAVAVPAECAVPQPIAQQVVVQPRPVVVQPKPQPVQPIVIQIVQPTIQPSKPVSLPVQVQKQIQVQVQKQQVVQTQTSGCEDKHEYCSFWASTGECTKNPFWTKVNCPASCKSCGATVQTINQPEVIAGCGNSHELCEFWKTAGECNNNSLWMRNNCQLSCGTCGGAGVEE